MQVQTEGTGLAVVEESSLGAATPPIAGWYTLEPNSYGKFGSAYKKLPRNPITKSAQLQKGMLVDEDSGIDIDVDVTMHHIDRFARGIFRSIAKHSGNKGQSQYPCSGVTSTGYTVTALGDLGQGFLINARGFGIDANNGLKVVGAGSVNAEIHAPGLVVETTPPANAIVGLAGFRGASGDIQLDSSGNLTCAVADFTTWGLYDYQWLYVGGVDPTTAFATLAFTGVARIARNGVTAHKIVLERRSWDVGAHAFLALGTVTSDLDTVVEAIASGVSGNSIRVRAVDDGVAAVKASLNLATKTTHDDTVIEARAAGTAGNSITVDFIPGASTGAGVLTEIGTNVTIKYKTGVSTVANIETLIGTSTLIEVKTTGTGATVLVDPADSFTPTALSGGVNATAPTAVDVGTDTTIHFTGGYSTVAQIEAAIASSANIRVRTTGTQGNIAAHTVDEFAFTNLAGGTSGADTGAGKTIDIYFSRWYRNVAIDHTDYIKPSYAFEETYQTLSSSGGQEFEYFLGNMVDEWTWNFPLTTKATINMKFVGTKSQDPSVTRHTGPSTARDPVTKVGISTAQDLARLRMSNVDETGISTDFKSLKIMAKNNVSPDKVLGKLGADRMNIGEHMVTVEADLVFVTDDIIKAVRDNRTACLDVLMRNTDFGALIDVQAMTIDSKDLKLEKNKSVLVAAKSTGHQHSLSGSTQSLSVFEYLPVPSP